MWLAVEFGHLDNILAKTLEFLYQLGLITAMSGSP